MMTKATTKTCSKCKTEKPIEAFSRHRRYKDGRKYQCKVCCSADFKAWRAKGDNAEKQRLYAKTYNPGYYQENQEVIKVQVGEYREAHPEEVAAAKRASWDKNPEQYKATIAEWREANPEKVKGYAFTQKGRREDRTASATIPGEAPTPLDLKMILIDHKNLCYVCGDPWEHWDHVTPVSRGGLHHRSNLRPMCAPCNLSKGAKTLKEWL